MKAILSVLIAVLLNIAAAGQTPKLNSYTSAQAVIFLDFDGHIVQGTSWNWGGPIVAQASGLSSAAITEIFNRVAEDYRIFNLNITTDSTVYAAAPINKRARLIVTPTYEWYGMAGGVSYVGSFAWGDETPSWVFSGLLNNNVKYVAEAISHEAGHALGLQHQSRYDTSCNKMAEYAGGQGSGEISWAPIMGVGYYTNITTWHNGPNSFGCSYLQNDIDIIAGSPNNFGLRQDDYGNDHAHASMTTTIGQNFEIYGLINTSQDKDVFQLPVTYATNFRLNAVPKNVGNSNSGANVDIRVSLLSANGDTLSRYNPTELMNAGIDTSLNIGTYYLVVEGVGNINLLDYGSVGLYTLYGTLAGVLSGEQVQLTGRADKGTHRLSWNAEQKSLTGNIILEYSADAINFEELARFETTDRTFEWKPTSNQTYWYRLRWKGPGEREHYSNIVTIAASIKAKEVVVQTTNVRNEVVVSAMHEYRWELLNVNGSLMRSGRLTKGINYLTVQGLPSGLMVLKVIDNAGAQSYKIIKQ